MRKPGQFAGEPLLLPIDIDVEPVDRADNLKPATLNSRLTAIAKAHSAAGYYSPASLRHAVVSELLTGIQRTMGTAQL